ncbi:substrate-binding periplasmic protein [Alishewanella longhuensis]
MLRSCCVFILLCFSLPLGASERYCPDRPLLVGLFYYGHIYREDRTGIDHDLLQLLQNRTGCNLTAEVMPRARTWYNLEQGLLDMTSTGILTEDRAKHSWFIPYMQLKNYLIVPASLPREQKDAAGFIADTNLYFGAVRGFKHGEPLDKILTVLAETQRVLYYPDAPTLFYALKRGRIQAMFSQPPIYRYFLADELDQGLYQLLDWAPELTGTAHHLVLQRQTFSASQAEAWQQLIQQLMQQGELSKIYHAYLAREEACQLELAASPKAALCAKGQ